jgi:hypothetical protein
MTVSEARRDLTHLDDLLRPGEKALITRRNRPYLEVRVVEGPNPYEHFLAVASDEGLPPAGRARTRLSTTYKRLIYGGKRVKRGR